MSIRLRVVNPKSNVSEGEEMKCPYCGGKAHLINASSFYHNNKYKGKMYLCENFPKCDSYVGCHPNTTTPLGRMANRKLRRLKEKAHEVFDPLWKEKTFSKSRSFKYNRTKAYKWLSEQLDITPKKCHIGKFDEDTCRKAIRICHKRKIELGMIKKPYEKGYKNHN